MTAILCVCQPRHNCAHIATDAAMYRDGEGVTAFGSKAAAISHWGILTAAGTSLAVPLLAFELGKTFHSWDDFTERAETELPNLAELVASYGNFHATVVLAGVSERRGPESFTFQTTLKLPPGVSLEEAQANPYFQLPFKLARLPDYIATPVPPPEMSLAAAWDGIDVDADPDVMDWLIRKHLTMQRHMPLPDDIGGIGGWIDLITARPDGITQRILQRWPGDRIGAPLRPAQIDWDRWHAENPHKRKARKFGVVR